MATIILTIAACYLVVRFERELGESEVILWGSNPLCEEACDGASHLDYAQDMGANPAAG